MFEKNRNSISVAIMRIRREESIQRTEKGKYKPAIETKAESSLKTRDQQKNIDITTINAQPTRIRGSPFHVFTGLLGEPNQI